MFQIYTEYLNLKDELYVGLYNSFHTLQYFLILIAIISNNAAIISVHVNILYDCRYKTQRT